MRDGPLLRMSQSLNRQSKKTLLPCCQGRGSLNPRGATPLRRATKNPAVKRRMKPVSLCENRGCSPNSPRIDNGSVPGKDYWTAVAAVHPSTPWSIRGLRCCLLFSFRRLSVARSDRYSSSSMSVLSIRLVRSILAGACIVKATPGALTRCMPHAMILLLKTF